MSELETMIIQVSERTRIVVDSSWNISVEVLYAVWTKTDDNEAIEDLARHILYLRLKEKQR